MPNTIGVKIKELRRELKLTQSELAGNDMTKSMLSQIENNLSTPSMKNLRIIANKLGKPISYFIDEDNKYKIKLPLNEILKKIKTINRFMDEYQYIEAEMQLSSLLSSYNFTDNDTLYGDILYKQGVCLGNVNIFDKSEQIIRKVIKIYKNCNLYPKAATAYLEMTNRFFSEYNYEPCLSILDNANEIYSLSTTRDYCYEINSLYLRSLVYAGLSEFDKTLQLLNDALLLSKERNFYYKCDILYQTTGSINLILNNFDKFEYNMLKANQFAIFTENKLSLSLIYLNYAEYQIKLKNPKEALEYLDQIKDLKIEDTLSSFINIERAKAFYLHEEYDQALSLFKKINYSTERLQKHDYLFFWATKIYHAHTLIKLGKLEQALIQMNLGIKKLERFNNSIYHVFAYKGMSSIYSSKQDYETAYKYLKKANDMESELNGLPYKR